MQQGLSPWATFMNFPAITKTNHHIATSFDKRTYGKMELMHNPAK
jgi:hypothetical protein